MVLTHHHTDHALGASWFAGHSAEVVAQRRCAEAMAAFHPALVAQRRADPALAALFADAESRAPAVIFDDRWRADLGDLPVEVRRAGPAHTPGDAIVLLPSERAVACGDLVSAGYHFNYEDAEPAELAGALASLAASADLFVPGHGAPGGKEIVEAQARYHEEVARIVAGSGTAAAARAAIRTRFPGWLLEVAIETALARFLASP